MMKNTFFIVVVVAMLSSAEQTTTSTFSTREETSRGLDNGNITDEPPTGGNSTMPNLTTQTPRRRSPVLDGLVSEETYERFEKTAQYLSFVLLISGVVLNILNILVFNTKEMRSPSCTILIAISISELAIMILQATVKLIGVSYGARMRSTYLFLVAEQYLSMYGSSAVGRSVYCYTLFLASQRLVAVAFPLKSMRYRLIQKPGLYCIAVLVVSTIYHLYIPFNYTVISYKSENETRYRYGYTGYYLDNNAVFKGISLAGRIVFIYLPLLGCLVVNLMLVFVLKYHSWKRQNLQLNQESDQMRRSERQTTVTIMVSTVVFVILIMPYQANSLAVQFSQTYGMYRSNHWLYLTINQVGGLCILLSSSTNFIFYCILGGNFRKTLISKFRKCRNGKVMKRKEISGFPSATGSSLTVDTGLSAS